LSDICSKNLIILLRTRVDYIAAESIVVLRNLITKDPVKYHKVIVHCAKINDSLSVPRALASSIWIIGQYAETIPTLSVETFRKLVLGFKEYESQVKFQVLNMGLKMVLKSLMPERVSPLFEYLI
jgi:AP-3 complex subunit beta